MIPQFLSKKWKPYEEPAEHIIRDRESKIKDVKFNGSSKALIFFILGVMFTSLLFYF